MKIFILTLTYLAQVFLFVIIVLIIFGAFLFLCESIFHVEPHFYFTPYNQ